MSRKATPTSDEILVLTNSRRKCCICYGLHNDLSVKRGQIAHIDRNHSNSTFENLAWMCLEHHDLYDSRTSQSKGFKPREIIFYRDALYKFVDDHWGDSFVFQELPTQTNAKFLIGERLKHVRSEVELNEGEFIDLIGYESEKKYLEMESDSLECSFQVIQRISNATGVSINWLKYGHSPAYSVEPINWFQHPVQSAKDIANIAHKFVYLTVFTPTKASFPLISKLRELYAIIHLENLHVGVCVQVQPHKYRVYDMNINLDYWDGYSKQGRIQSFYAFITELIENYLIFDFRILQISRIRDNMKLYRGEIHPHIISRKYWKHSAMAYDIFEENKIRQYEDFQRKHYGKWVYKIQKNIYEQVLQNTPSQQ